MLSNLSDSSR